MKVFPTPSWNVRLLRLSIIFEKEHQSHVSKKLRSERDPISRLHFILPKVKLPSRPFVDFELQRRLPRGAFCLRAAGFWIVALSKHLSIAIESGALQAIRSICSCSGKSSFTLTKNARKNNTSGATSRDTILSFCLVSNHISKSTTAC